MRKMQKYIVKGKRVFVGLEDSKRSWKVCVRSDRMVVHEVSMPADYGVLQRYLLDGYPDCRIQVIYEAGFSGFWLHDYLAADGFDCIVTPPHKVTQAKVNKVKTDRIDARRLALTLENGDYTRCHVPDRERREDRQISRTLDQVQRKIVSVKNQIRRFLDFHGLNDDLPPGAWTATHYRRLQSLVLSPSLKVSFEALMRHLVMLTDLRDELKKHLQELCTKERYRAPVLSKKSCPGVGWLTAIRLTLEWGEMSRFKTGKHIASFTGLTSREYSTGEHVNRGRITAQSPRQVRSWLIQCAWRAVRIDPVLMNKLQTVWKNSGSKKKGIVAVARKLAVRMRAIELAEQTYVPGLIE